VSPARFVPPPVPPKIPGPHCMVCKRDLETRPVPRQVTSTRPCRQCNGTGFRRSTELGLVTGDCEAPNCNRGRIATGKTFTKHVHMKPAQVVIACHVEGSHERANLPADIRTEKRGGRTSAGALGPMRERILGWELRVCVTCIQGRSFAEVVAVALDHRLESEEPGKA